MSDLRQMKVFVAVAELGGFAAAARALQLSPPAVTRSIAGLESRLRARLLRRTTRSVKLTEVGERYFEDCRRILGEVEQADAIARGAHVEPQGELRLTAPVMFGRLHIAPIVLDFLARFEKVTARTYYVDRIVHLLDEGYDVAVRIAALTDSSVVAVRVGSVRQVVVAAPAYLREHGTPRNPGDLAKHRAIGISRDGATSAVWQFPGRSSKTPQPQIRLRVNSNDVAIAAAMAGHGLARTLSYQVAADVAAGRLKILLRTYEPPPIPVHLVYPEGRMAAAKVRAFVELAAARLRREPALR